MSLRRLWVVVICSGLAGCGLAGCDLSNLGAEDHARIVVAVASDQPADPADGVSVEISAYCGSGKARCLLQVDVVGGLVLRPGDGQRAAAFCQQQELLAPMPVLVFATGQTMEVVVRARLLDGNDATMCTGTVLSETQRPVPARAAAPPDAAGAGDAGTGDAGGNDAG